MGPIVMAAAWGLTWLVLRWENRRLTPRVQVVQTRMVVCDDWYNATFWIVHRELVTVPAPVGAERVTA